MQPPGKKVAVLGLGKSGFQSALFLKGKGFDVFASDQSDSPAVSARVQELRRNGIEAEAAKHTRERILEADWVLISPGISPASSIYQAVAQKKIPIYSEIELASWYSPTPEIIAVTGTTGKTTVTTLLARVFQKAGFRAVSCGNIGNPWIGEMAGLKRDDIVVLEVSSFQLEHCVSFRPKIGVLLNLGPNHQDWHCDMQEYVDAKLRLFRHQTVSDYALLRRRDRTEWFPAASFAAQVIYFDEKKEDNPNEAVLRAVSAIYGLKPAVVDQVLAEFEGIEHRLENAAYVRGIRYVNDSKSTSVASLVWGLEKYPDEKVILIAGGHPKSKDFHTIRDLVARKVKCAVLIGEARPILHEAWQGACPLLEAEGFREAVAKAHDLAQEGDIVLLSPACASFDMFQNYEERGRLFKEIVREIVGEKQAIG